ncbi:hypothetical protein ACH4T9_28820 [Micromonospora sp. NPDC020750]|uniref:hypothetical protein n=1 Tax=unclassified Micromonospora TaxID=2617518 RepID=UPI0037963669
MWAGRYLDAAVRGLRSAEVALHLARFRDYSHAAHGHERLSAVVQREVVAWRTHLTANRDAGGLGLAPATVNTHLVSLSGFTTWVCAHDRRPAAHAPGSVTCPLEPRALSPGQVRTLKNVLDRLPRFHRHEGRRRGAVGELHGRYAIVYTLLGTGLRREELVNLDLDQVTPNTRRRFTRRRRRRSAACAARAGPAAPCSSAPTAAPPWPTTWNTNAPAMPARRRPRCSCPPPRSAPGAPTAGSPHDRST